MKWEVIHPVHHLRTQFSHERYLGVSRASAKDFNFRRICFSRGTNIAEVALCADITENPKPKLYPIQSTITWHFYFPICGKRSYHVILRLIQASDKSKHLVRLCGRCMILISFSCFLSIEVSTGAQTYYSRVQRILTYIWPPPIPHQPQNHKANLFKKIAKYI